MDERLVALVKSFIPDAEVKKIYKSPEGEIMVDVNAPGMGELSCTVKKNHAGELYLE
jgi:hypothetical protein